MMSALIAECVTTLDIPLFSLVGTSNGSTLSGIIGALDCVGASTVGASFAGASGVLALWNSLIA